MILTYAVLLMVTLVIKATLSSLALGIYDDVINYDINKFSNDFEKSFSNYWTDDADRDYIDGIQSKLSCCGSTGPSDFNQTVPKSCCKTDQSAALNSTAACNSTTAYQVGCPLGYTELTQVTYKSASWVFGLLSTGVALIVLVAVVCVIQLANVIKNVPKSNRSIISTR